MRPILVVGTLISYLFVRFELEDEGSTNRPNKKYLRNDRLKT